MALSRLLLSASGKEASITGSSRPMGGNSLGIGGCWETMSSGNMAPFSTQQLNPTVTVHSHLTERGSTLSLVKQSRKPAREPWLQTGQAHLGARGSHCRGVACEPRAPVGQADWGRPPQPPTGLSRRSSRFAATPPPPTPLRPPTGLSRLVKQARNPAEKTSINMRLKLFLVQNLGRE